MLSQGQESFIDLNFSTGLASGHGQLRGRGHGGHFQQGSTKHSGIFYAYCMEREPLNIFENQVIPTGVHDISKRFRPKLAPRY